MKTLIILIIVVCWALAVSAQPTIDTSRKKIDSVYRGAWNQRPETIAPGKQQPISSQPLSNPPTPAQTTNPIDNPTSGQTHEPQYNQPLNVPPPQQRFDTLKKQQKPVIPVRPVIKASDYDTLPGTKRNG